MSKKLRQIAAMFLTVALLAGTTTATEEEQGQQEPQVLPDFSAVVEEPEQTQAPAGDAADVSGTIDDPAELPLEETDADKPLDEYADMKIRVGLAYAGNSRGTLVEAKLLISEGYPYGFRFGYYDSELNFVPLAYAEDIRDISMVKTTNVHLNKTDFAEGVSQTEPAVGCYHLQYPQEFEDFETASAFAAGYEGAFVAWIDGAYRVRCNSYVSNQDAQNAYAAFDDGTWTVCYTSVYGINVFRSDTTRILFQFDGGAELSLGVMAGLSDDVNPPSWFKGYKYQGGMRYQRIDGGNITVVNIVPLDMYLKGVVPYESVKVWPLETLKAQALCAKNYVLVSRNKHRDNGFDVCYTTDCQVYYGLGSGNESFQPSQLSDQAVDEIRGLYVWYGDKLAQTYFYSSNGGGSEDVSNIWGSKQENYPYLAGVIDPYEATVAEQIPNYYFSSTWTNDKLTEILRSKGYATNTSVVDFDVEYSRSGNVIVMKFTYANGKSNTFKAANTSWIRNKLGCRSVHFTVLGGGDVIPQECKVNADTTVDSLAGMYAIGADGTAVMLDTAVPYAITGNGEIISTGAASTVPEGTYLINGTGWGHNIGYSQWGGYAMAKLGFTCEQIIEFYFTGVKVGPKVV